MNYSFQYNYNTTRNPSPEKKKHDLEYKLIKELLQARSTTKNYKKNRLPHTAIKSMEINYDIENVDEDTGGIHPPITFTMHNNNLDASFHPFINIPSTPKSSKTPNKPRIYHAQASVRKRDDETLKPKKSDERFLKTSPRCDRRHSYRVKHLDHLFSIESPKTVKSKGLKQSNTQLSTFAEFAFKSVFR
jgi:hypothetical protein